MEASPPVMGRRYTAMINGSAISVAFGISWGSSSSPAMVDMDS